jgi:hypothetical protein
VLAARLREEDGLADAAQRRAVPYLGYIVVSGEKPK